MDRNDGPTISEAKERQLVISLSRKDLEDRYLRLREEHTELKMNTHKQEHKMKQMATKLLRLVKDRKKLEEGVAIPDLESRDKVEELKVTVGSLEKQNNQLKSKLLVARQQLQTHGKKTTPYDHIQSRINTGISPKKGISLQKQQRIREQMRVQGSPTPARDSAIGQPPVLPQPRYGHSLLEEARLEKQELEDLVSHLQEQLGDYENKIDFLQEQIHQKEIEHEEDLQKLRQQVSGNQRSSIQENVELIKLQREVKDKVAKLQSLQGKYQNLEELLNKVKSSHEQSLQELEKLASKLKEEQVKNTNLQNDLKHGNISQRTLAQKEEQITDVKAEVQLLKEAHEKLLSSTFDAEREREHRAKEKQYQIKIAQLEATIKADVTEKNVVLDRLTSERDVSDSSQKQYRELQVQYYALKEKHDDLTEKLKFFTSESVTDFEEIQEALLLIKTRKERASQDLNFLEKVDEEINQDVRKQMQELQAAHAETINELEKTRSMLLLQHNINKDYQKEVELTTKKMEELKRESDTRVHEYAQLLDIRAERIKKLESQLRDVAYGTKQFKIKPEDEITEVDEDPTVKLERGQNIFEIHIGQINITKNGLERFNGAEPMTFISFEFFEYELQATPVAQGSRPNFNHTSQYVVQVDDFFLHYLQKETMLLEFHQAFGTEYQTIARATIKFNELMDKSHGRLHGKVVLFENDKEIVSVEYWLRLRVPMEQALRLYKERTKALGYITSNDLKKLEHPTKQSLKDSGINELKVTIIQCLNLNNIKDVQPCSYCVYKFYDFPDHDTEIVKNSNSPQFHDYRAYPVPMTEELDNYLKNAHLQIYVFDDLDTEPTAYIGVAMVPLITLTHDKPLKGKFQLKNRIDEVSGYIDVSLEWEYTYLPASAKKVRTYPKPVNTAVDHDAVYTPGSRSTMQPMVSAGKLFEPHSVGEYSVESKETVLEPMYDRKKDGPTRNTRYQNEVGSKTNMLSEDKRTNTGKELYNGKISESANKGKGKQSKENIDETNMKTMNLDELESVLHDESQKNTDDDRETGNESDQAFLEEELRRTVEAPSPLPQAADTMFEERLSEEDSDEDIVIPSSARVTKQPDDVSVTSEDTEEDVVISTSRGRAASLKLQAPTSITVIINSLTLFEDAPMLEMQNIKQLFVSYKFLDYDPELLETPMSLPKPKPNRPLSFNFKKVFHIDEGEHLASRQYLMHLLMPDHPNEGRLFFTVVSDPMDDEDEDCDDVGIAYVDLIQMLRDGKDLIDHDVDVYDLVGTEGNLIGVLNVTVEAITALRSLYQ